MGSKREADPADGGRAPSAGRLMPGRAALPIVAGLTVLGFALRFAGIDQSLFGDEETLYYLVHGAGLGGVLDVVTATEKTPPLHFLLAWGAAQLGDATIWTRVPSLVLGTATVPLVYVLGLRTVGQRAGVVAAAVVALAPFAVFYGVQNRAYATLTFFSALSTLMLLRALRRGGFLSWFAFGVSTAAVLYTHYTGAFVVLAQLGWALWTHRDRARQLVLVHVGVALAFVPWLPSFFTQFDHSSDETTRLAKSFPLSVDKIREMVTSVIPGYPPGPPWVAIVWATIGFALLIAAIDFLYRRRGRPAAPSPTAVLIVVLALVTPVGIVLYSVQPDTSLLLSRNLSASLPAFALLVGWLLTSLRPWFAVPAAGLLLAALGVGAIKTLDPDEQQPAYREVAHYLDKVSGPRDAILTSQRHSLLLYMKGVHRVFVGDDPVAWRAATQGARTYLVQIQLGSLGQLQPLAGPDNRIQLRGQKRFRGRFPLAVGTYAGQFEATIERRGGRSVIAWSLGRDLVIRPGSARGVLEAAGVKGTLLELRGWATDGAGQAGADWVLAFSGRRLLAVGQPSVPRPDVAKDYGRGAILSGYTLTASLRSRKLPRRLRVFAVAGESASEVRLTGPARAAIPNGTP